MGWADADGPDPGIPLLFLTPLLGRLCGWLGTSISGMMVRWTLRSMGASVAMGLAKAFPLRADQSLPSATTGGWR